MKSYLAEVFTNTYFLLFVTAALGAALGKIKLKSFSLGSTGGIFSGILIGWLVIAIAKGVPESSPFHADASRLINGGLVSSSFMMFFLILFICAVGLSVGGKLKAVLNRNGIKLVCIGVLIPIIPMVLTWGCLMAAPHLMGSSYNGYAISGLYSGAMTNTAAYGTSLEVVGDMSDHVQEKYAALSDSDKSRLLEMAGVEDTSPIPELDESHIAAFLEKAKSYISLGYAISFPVGTIVIILAMTLISMCIKKDQKPADHAKPAVARDFRKSSGGKPFFFSAVIFGLVISVGLLIGHIKIPFGGSVTFSLSAVGGVLISALIFSNIPKIGPFGLAVNPKALAFVREFSLIFFMSVVGLSYGYDVVSSFSGSGLILALMAIFIETAAIILAILVGRRLMKMHWGLLSGAICGGCTSAVGLGAALSTMDSEEPTLGYGVAQPFAILANILLISLFHSSFFI